MSDPQQTLAKLNNLYTSNGFEWVDPDISSLPSSTAEYVSHWLVETNAQFTVARQIVNGVYVFKVDNPVVKYLVHDSKGDRHMWGDENFNNIENNTALVALVSAGNQSKILQAYGPDGLKKIFDSIDAQQNN